jgi:hypothetical protein
MKIQTSLIGAAGEHLVLSRLLRKGVLASQSPFNASRYDILVNTRRNQTPVLIQVKTTSQGKSNWQMKPEDANSSDKNFYYCFVDLSTEPEKVYVVPSKKVSQVLVEADKAWMSKPRKDGTKKAEHKMRMLKNKFILDIKSAPDGWMDKYLEKWEVFTK